MNFEIDLRMYKVKIDSSEFNKSREIRKKKELESKRRKAIKVKKVNINKIKKN